MNTVCNQGQGSKSVVGYGAAHIFQLNKNMALDNWLCNHRYNSFPSDSSLTMLAILQAANTEVLMVLDAPEQIMKSRYQDTIYWRNSNYKTEIKLMEELEELFKKQN